jgi:hypothetical protein
MNTKSFEEKIEALGQRAEAGVRGWVRNDSAFNFLRSTPARIVLALLTVGVLYGVPAWQMFNRGVSLWLYAGLLVGCVLLQKLSVRFAFDDDSEIDEYQHQRRNRAYRRAYKRVATIIGIALGVVAAQGYDLKHTLGSGFKYSFDLASENWLFVGVFVIGLFVLQKYLSWGIKGESWADRTRP